MPRFFLPAPPPDGWVTVEGEDAQHISRSLRMKVGDELLFCDGQGTDYRCALTALSPSLVTAQVLERFDCQSEPALKLHLYQALPKADKLEWIIQKAVELGASSITPVLTSRCISRPQKDQLDKKLARWNKIAQEAAKQSGRGILPPVHPLLSWEEALAQASAQGPSILCYEGGGAPLGTFVQPGTSALSLFVGAEGGFSPDEVALAKQYHCSPATLGPRILRCETAPLCAISILMYLSDHP